MSAIVRQTLNVETTSGGRARPVAATRPGCSSAAFSARALARRKRIVWLGFRRPSVRTAAGSSSLPVVARVGELVGTAATRRTRAAACRRELHGPSANRCASGSCGLEAVERGVVLPRREQGQVARPRAVERSRAEVARARTSGRTAARRRGADPGFGAAPAGAAAPTFGQLHREDHGPSLPLSLPTGNLARRDRRPRQRLSGAASAASRSRTRRRGCSRAMATRRRRWTTSRPRSG